MQSDNGDGTYTNPIIFADFPDPDVIRVDSIYYMVTTTMFIFPGVTILKSYDLVNWEYCCNAIQRMDYSPCYNLDGCDRYSDGQWATSLKYKDGNVKDINKINVNPATAIKSNNVNSDIKIFPNPARSEL